MNENLFAILQSRMPDGVDARSWFMQVDWEEVATQLDNTPGDFVDWLAADETPQAQLLFEVMSVTHPVTFGRILQQATVTPVVSGTIVGQIGARLIQPDGFQWLTTTMAMCHDIRKQLEANAAETAETA